MYTADAAAPVDEEVVELDRGSDEAGDRDAQRRNPRRRGRLSGHRLSRWPEVAWLPSPSAPSSRRTASLTRLGHQHLGAGLVDVALAHQVPVGQRRVESERRRTDLSPIGTIGAPPARRSSRLSALLTTITWVSHTWLCRRVPFLIMLCSLWFFDELAAQHLAGRGGGQFVTEYHPVGCSGSAQTLSDVLAQLVGIGVGALGGHHHRDDDLAPLGVLGSDDGAQRARRDARRGRLRSRRARCSRRRG